jgi:hypothetical protein
MLKEKRTIVLVILTIFIYAITLYFEINSFIFPFPIFDFIILILAFQFGVWNLKDIVSLRKWYIILYFSALITRLLTNPLFWGLFLNEIALEQLMRSDSLNLLKICYALISLLVFFCWSYVEKFDKRIYSLSLLILVQFFGIFEFSYLCSYLIYLVFAGYIFLQKQSNSFGYLILLHGILDLFTLFMLLKIN